MELRSVQHVPQNEERVAPQDEERVAPQNEERVAPLRFLDTTASRSFFEPQLFLFIMSIMSNTELMMMNSIVVRRRPPLSGKSLRHPCHVFPCDYGYVSIVFCPPPTPP